MSASLMPNGKQQFLNASGAPLAGGKVYTYAAGTTTNKATYTTAAASVQNANPVILDARGEAAIFWSGAYNVVVKDANDTLIYSTDNYTPVVDAFTASTGSSLIGFIQSGTGATLRTAQDKLRESFSVKDFGAVGNGSADDTAAIQAAINAVNTAGGGTVLFPTGNYKVSATITLYANVSLVGLSEYGAQILAVTAGMTVFSLVYGSSSLANVRISSLDIYCTAANITGCQFTYCNRVTLNNMVFYGCLYNFIFDRGGMHEIELCKSANASALKSGAIKMWSSTDTEYGAVFSSIVGYRIENNGAGVQSPAIYFRRAVGIKVTNLLTTNNAAHGNGTCVLIENDCQGITIANGLIVDYDLGVVFQTGAGVANQPIVNILSDVDFDQCRTNSILFLQGKGNQVVGGVITSSAIATTAQAIVINSGASENTINGTHIGGYYGAGGTGVYLNGCSYNRLYGVQVEGSTQGVAFNGTVTQTHIANCDFSSAVTTAIAGTYTGAGNRLIDVKGFSATSAITSPAVPASTVGVTNNYGVPCRVLVIAGTVTNVSINGNICGFTNSWFLLMPGESISINYTVAPTWNWVGI